MADETRISVEYAHAVISTLIDLGYATRTEAYKIKVVSPTLLLKRWAAYHQHDKANTFLEYYTFEQEVERFSHRLSTITSIPYALTGLAGAFLVAPHVRPVDVHLYVNREDVKTLAEALKLQPIPRGGNVKFVIPYDEGVYYGQQSALFEGNMTLFQNNSNDLNINGGGRENLNMNQHDFNRV